MFGTFFLLVTLLLVSGTIENHNNNTQTRSWKYFGHFLSKFNGVLTGNVLSAPGPTVASPAPNQPFSFIPPQALPVVVATPIPATVPSFNQDFPLSVIPPGNSATNEVPTTIIELPPLNTISPDTAGFPVFDTEEPVAQEILPPPSLTDVEVSAAPSPFPTTLPQVTPVMFIPAATSPALPLLTGPPEGAALAQTFPVVIPLPSATAAALTQCRCVTAGTCVTTQVPGGAIDLRIVTQNPGVVCAVGEQYCCTQTSQPQQTNCGIQNVVAGVAPRAGQANLGEFPWSGIILNAANQYIGGAALIDSTHLLTAAHLVASYGNGAGLKIRLGEWDLTGSYEPVPFVEIAVLRIVTHPAYTSTTLQNDLAVITLSSPVSFLASPSPQINSVCLPLATDVFTGSGCFVAGWGRDAFGGNYQNIIKKVDVPVVAATDCQTRLRQTKLGPNWALDTTSFICAGGEISKDACQGDGGNALVCLRNGVYVVAGITAAGVECGRQGVPGLYVNVVSYLNWINEQTQAAGSTSGSIDPRRQG